jgi:phage repressor protein C with HTH and peptisase S24 domain
MERNWTLDDLVERAGVSRGTISLLERGESNPTQGVLEKIAAALDTKVQDLYSRLTAQPTNEADPIDIDISHYIKADIPVLGPAEATTAGLIAWSNEGVVRNQVDRWISRPSWIRDNRAYGLIVRGDSMEPRYFAGELIIASPNAVISSGNFACVILKTGERMIKRVYRQTNGWNLISMNDKYEPRFVSDEEIAAIHKIVHNSQDAISVAKEEIVERLKRPRTPKGVTEFAEHFRDEADSQGEGPED